MKRSTENGRTQNGRWPGAGWDIPFCLKENNMAISDNQDVTVTDEFVYFWNGWPSQWHRCRFAVDGVEYNCAEQFMMAEKAALFGDSEVLRQILASTNPREQKALGRVVRGFDPAVWDRHCREVVYRGNLAKFGQNAGLRKLLLETGSKRIVEASPTDAIWGIGLAADDPRALDPAQWRGTNWLGGALVRVRETLITRGR
jgi:ribA/ribD-fused uncharacterized protein